MAYQISTEIDMYPGTLALEDVPAEFDIEYEYLRADDSGPAGCYCTAKLVRAYIGGMTATREMVAQMVGSADLAKIERDAADGFAEVEMRAA